MARVMVADDDQLVIDLIRFRLTRLGYEVDSATDGAMLLERLQAEPADLLILDYLIPGVSAKEIVKEVGVPIIMLTVEWREQDVIDILDSGVSDYLTKPFSPEELIRRVKRSVATAE